MGRLLLLLLLVWLFLLLVISIFLRGLCNAWGDVKVKKKARGEEEEEEEEERIKDGYLRKRGEQFREKPPFFFRVVVEIVRWLLGTKVYFPVDIDLQV